MEFATNKSPFAGKAKDRAAGAAFGSWWDITWDKDCVAGVYKGHASANQGGERNVFHVRDQPQAFREARLEKECLTNLALRVEPGSTSGAQR